MHKYKYFFSKIKIFIYILYKKRGDFSPLPFFEFTYNWTKL